MPKDGQEGRLPEGAPTEQERKPLQTYPNVVATGFGLKEVGGELTDEHCVRVYVEEKVGEGELGSREKIPDEWCGYPTDVIVHGGLEPQAWARAGRQYASNDATIDPATASKIVVWDPDGNLGVGGGSCTPAFVDKNTGTDMMVTNHHVAQIGSESESEIVDHHYVGVHDYDSHPADHIGVVRDVEQNEVDAAWYDINTEDGVLASRHVWAGPELATKPADGWPTAELGRRYVNFGAKTGVTQGRCTDLDYDGGHGANSLQFEDYSNNGDSGSLTAEVRDDGKLVPIGLHWAGTGDDSEGYSYAHWIPEVESALGLDLDRASNTDEPNYSGVPHTAHFEMSPYRTYDDGEGNLVIQCVLLNSGGDSKQDTVDILDGHPDDTSSTVLASHTTTLAAGEHEFVELAVSDSYIGTTLVFDDDMENASEWQQTNGIWPYHREFSAVDEGPPPEETVAGDLRVGQFSLGQHSIGGVEITKKNAVATGTAAATSTAVGTLDSPTGSAKNAAATATAAGYGSAVGDLIEFIPDSEFWLIGGQRIDKVVSEERRWQELHLVAQTDASTVQNDIRPRMSNAGKYELHERARGGFVATDDTDGENTVQLASPKARRSLRSNTKWVVAEYDEEILDQAGNEYRVEITAVPLNNKANDGSYPSETRATNEWAFAFNSGTFTTRSVETHLGDRGREGKREKTLTTILDRAEAKTLEDHASRLGAVTRRQIPGGNNVAVDTSPDGRNTVSVTVPDGYESEFSEGDYVVTDWVTETLGDDAYRVEISLLPVG